MVEKNLAFKNVLLENLLISIFLLLILIFFSDYSNINFNLKIIFLNFFFISNFFEIFFLDKKVIYKNNFFVPFHFYSLFIQLFFLNYFIQKIKKINFFINYLSIILIFSFIYFISNSLHQNYNLLPFDKIWLLFLVDKKLLNLKNLILLNRLSFLILIFLLLDIFISLQIIFLLIPFILTYLTKNIRINLYVKNKFLLIIYLILFLGTINVNHFSKIIDKTFKKFNIVNILSSKNFEKNHFVKEEFDEISINNFYKNVCLKNLKKCNFEKKYLFYLFGDTQANQYVKKILNLSEGKLIYLNTERQCLHSSNLIHANHIKYFFNNDLVINCNDNFYKMNDILSSSNVINKKKIIFIASWYNWYYSNKLILDKNKKIVRTESEFYNLIHQEYRNLFSKYSERKDLKFNLILPLPQFKYSPSLCGINNSNCLIKFDDHLKEISKLKIIYYKIKKEFDNVNIVDISPAFCDYDKNFCSMKGKEENFKISYRDKENLSHHADIDINRFFLN